jgi:hypothetical protein
MLCSNCLQEIKPVVAIDIDGTLGDYHRHFCDFAAAYFGIAMDSDHIDYDAHLFKFSTWWAMKTGLSVSDYRQAKLAYRQGGMKRTMPIFDGARALCWATRDAGAELWVTTTRPYLSLDNIVPDTIEWLRRHEIEYDGMLFDDDKYEQLQRRVNVGRVAAIFDDTPELYDAAETQFPGTAWLVDGVGNKGVRRDTMCDLDAAADLATNAVHTWRSVHESV